MEYYKKILETTKALMDAKDYAQAYALLSEEVKMPYIPREYEDTLREYHQICEREISISQKVKRHEEDIEALLFGNVDEACMACEILKGSNVRKYLDVVERYLKAEPHILIRTLLIETLMEQDITSEIEMDYEGLDITFIPTYIEPLNQNENIKIAIEKLQDYFENDNPSFFQMCVDTLIKELCLKLPFNLEVDDIDYLLVAIIAYVFKANGDEVGFDCFINEKNLALYGGYDLLLYKYNI